MIISNLYYSKIDNRYFWTGNDLCSKCHKLVSLQGILVWDYWQTHLRESLFCGNCKVEALNLVGKYAEIKPVVIGFSEMLPHDVIGVVPTKPMLITGSGNVFEVAVEKLEGKVVDRTTLVKPLMLGGKKDKLLLNSDETR